MVIDFFLIENPVGVILNEVKNPARVSLQLRAFCEITRPAGRLCENIQKGVILSGNIQKGVILSGGNEVAAVERSLNAKQELAAEKHLNRH